MKGHTNQIKERHCKITATTNNYQSIISMKAFENQSEDTAIQIHVRTTDISY